MTKSGKGAVQGAGCYEAAQVAKSRNSAVQGAAGNPRFQDWEALVRTFEKRQCPELGTYAPMTSNSWEWQFYKAIFFSSFDDAYFFVFGCRASIRERCKRSKGETLSSRQIGKKNCRASEHMSHVF